MTEATRHRLVSRQFAGLGIHRPAVRLCLVLALTVIGFMTYLSVGSAMISPVAAIRAIVAPAGGDHVFVVQTLRLPRALLALLVGAGLGAAGAILQYLVRNPLASPDIIGISDGAAVGAVLFLAWLAGTISLDWLPPIAIASAMITAFLIVGLAWQNGIVPIRMILLGIALAAALKAITTLVLVMSPLSTTVRSYIWLTGSLYGAEWADVLGLLPWTLTLLPLTLVLVRPLTLLAFNDEQSVGLGLAVGRYRAILLGCSVGLAGSAVAFAGGIAFVGLIAPHLARRACGRSLLAVLPGAAVLGGLIVLVADLIGRTLFLPQDLPAGIFVSAVGAPFFIWLLYRRV